MNGRKHRVSGSISLDFCKEIFMSGFDRFHRDNFYVADKFNVQAEPDYEKQFARQLERLQMDRIDFYLLHGVTDKLIPRLPGPRRAGAFPGAKAPREN